MGNESTTLVHGCGCVDLRFSSGKVVSLLNVLHVRNIRNNLVSSSVLNNCGYKQVIESNKFMLSKYGVFIGFGYPSNHMFRLNIVSDNIGSAFVSTSKLNDSILWHARLGHVYFKRMQDMFKDGLIPAFDTDTEKCQTCMLNKITKKPFQNVKRETEVLELIDSDLCDLHATPSLGNKKYFVTFIDDASRFKTDKGGEYMDTLYFQSVGIIHETTAPYTPQQNDISERKNRVLKEMVNSMLSYSGLSQGAVVRLPDPKLKTLGERGIECIFVGYAEHSKGFRFYVIEPNDSVAINSIIELSNAIFDEHMFSYVPRSSQRSLVKGTVDSGGLVVSERVTDEIVQQFEPRKSKRHRTPKDFGPDFQLYLVEGTRDKTSGLQMDFQKKAEVARISTIRLLIAMTSIHCLIIHQMDVKIAFLNGELEEEVYMNQPLSFIFPGNENKVDLTKEFLSSMFSIKDMGEADVILGIKIKHESNDIAISQSHYIEKVLKKFNYSNWTPVSTSLDTCEKLMPNRGLTVSQLEYSRVIGCLMYAMTCTRPDIAFDVGKLSRYTSNPVLEGYTDASWISNTKDNSSTSGWVFLLGGGAISWASKKQTYITGSTMESKFVSLTAAGKEAEWLKNLLFEIPLWVKPMAPISICCDSAATLAKAYSQIYNGKSRHLGAMHSMIRELIMNGVISIEFVMSQQNLADHLTKGLARDLVLKSAKGMGLKSNEVVDC
ncbi:zinc finger, CCHC-type containing protein [Tanacetum coccineum]